MLNPHPPADGHFRNVPSASIHCLKLKGWTTTRSLIWIILFVFFFLFNAIQAEASHFRSGSITWRTVTSDLSQRRIEFKISQAWRRTAFGVTVLGQPVSTGAFRFGDGTFANIVLTVTSINFGEDWFYGEAIIVHTYSAATNYTAFFGDCCRVSTLENNADGFFRVETIVNAGSGNSSPVSTVSPIVNLPVGLANATFPVSVNDPDGDPLTFKLSTSQEMGGGTNPSGLGVDLNTGIASFNTVGRTVGDIFNASFTISDGKTKISVDYLIKITPPSTPAVFDYSITPPNGHIFPIKPGQTVNFGVRVSDSDPGDIVTLSAIGLPLGAVMSPPLPVSGNPAQSSFSWTPGINNLGTSVINFVAQDLQGVQRISSVTIQVSLKPVFDAPPTPPNGSSYQFIPGSAIAFTIQASDPDPADLVQLSATNLPVGSMFTLLVPSPANPVSSSLSWTAHASQWGEHTIDFEATDTYGESTDHQLNLVINSPPLFTSLPKTEIVAGELYEYTLSAIDPDLPYGDELRIIAPNLPSWLTLQDNGDGTATLRGSPQIIDQGLNPVTLVAEDIHHHGYDPLYNYHIQSFDINVIPCNVAIENTINKDVTCNGGSDGSITVNVEGGKPDYQFSKDNGATFQSERVFSALSAGTYTVIVKDANGCLTESVAVLITEPALLTASAVATDVNCYDGADGTITVAPSGGAFQSGYSFIWTTSDFNAQSVTIPTVTNVTKLAIGNTLGFGHSHNSSTPITFTIDLFNSLTQNWVNVFSVNATLFNFAGLTLSFPVIPEVTAIRFNSSTFQNSSFHSFRNTPIQIGDGYLFSIDGGNTFQPQNTFTNLRAGVYPVLVKDQSGCTAELSATVGQPAAPITASVIKKNVMCAGGNDGSITINASGGTPPYQYIITNRAFQSSNVFNSLTARVYTVRVRDSKGCILIAPNVTIIQEDLVAPVAIAQDINVQLDQFGKVTISAEQVNNGSSDACGIKSMALDKSEFDCQDIGQTNTVTLTVTDVNNNTSNATATVTVEDHIGPVALAKDITVQLDEHGIATIQAFDLDNGSSDACGFTLSLSKSSFNCEDTSAPVTVALIVTDNHANISKDEALVTVVDNVAPVAHCETTVEVFLGQSGTLNITAEQIDAGSDDACGIKSLTLSDNEFTTADVGDNNVILTVTDNNENQSTCNTNVVVKKRPVVLMNTSATEVQYSDLLNLKALLTDEITGNPLVGKTIHFTLGAQSASAVTAANGEAVASLIIDQQPGSYQLVATFDEDDIYLPGIDNDAFEIKPEDARITYAGALFASTSSSSSGSAKVTLSATIQDITAVLDDPAFDQYPGDIANASLSFLIVETGEMVSAPIGYVVSGDLKTGTATLTWNADIGSKDSETFTVRIIAGNYYHRDAADDNTVVTVSRPLNDFVTGGGYLLLANSSGEKAGDVGRKNNFGFNIKYNKKGTNLQGNINTIIRRTEADGMLHVYQVKGNSMTSLSVQPTTSSTGSAVFNGKANITDITDALMPVSVDGNATLQVEMTDLGEGGIRDNIAITVWKKDGGLWYSSNWTGTKTDVQTLGGGNIVVRGGAATVASQPAPDNTAATGFNSEPTLILESYPNPFEGRTGIRFSMLQSVRYSLDVYDMKGTKIKNLGEGWAEPGRIYEVAFDATGYTSGAYVARLSARTGIRYIKLIVR